MYPNEHVRGFTCDRLYVIEMPVTSLIQGSEIGLTMIDAKIECKIGAKVNRRQ